MIDSKEVNRFAGPLVLTNIGQIIIGQLALHFAVNNSSIFRICYLLLVVF